MPPQPITATVSPGRTFAVFITAPTPVVTPQPMSAALSSGMSGRIFTTKFSCTSSCSAKLAEVGELVHGLRRGATAAADRSGDRGASAPCRRGWAVRRGSSAHTPQKPLTHVITWSPGSTYVTCSPTASTTPADS